MLLAGRPRDDCKLPVATCVQQCTLLPVPHAREVASLLTLSFVHDLPHVR